MQLYDGRHFADGQYERYTEIRVWDDHTKARCLMYVEGPRPSVGDIWRWTSEVHVTNNDLRLRDKGVAVTTEVRIGPDSSHNRGYDTTQPAPMPFIRANGTFNVGKEAHHGLIGRTKSIEWTQEMVDAVADWDQVIAKFMIWASSTAYQSSDRLDIGKMRGFAQLEVFEAPE